MKDDSFVTDMISGWMDIYHLLWWGNRVWKLDLGEMQKFRT